MNVEQDYRRRGFMGKVGFGKKPAVLVIDLQKGFTDTTTLAGSDLTNVVNATCSILDVARKKTVPIIFTVIAYENDEDAGLWLKKAPAVTMFKYGSGYEEIDERLKRQVDEPIIYKRFASAFFGTPLVSYLVNKNIDTLIITGTSTSGCVRASAIDAFQNGFRVIVPEQAVGDRAEEPHRANLFDINAKYGDVVQLGQVLNYLWDLDNF